MDELDRRIRLLEAERLRPVPDPPPRPWHPDPRRAARPDQLAALDAEVRDWRDPEGEAGVDMPEQTEAEARREDYLWLRSQGETREEAAARVGIKPGTGRQYEHEMTTDT